MCSKLHPGYDANLEAGGLQTAAFHFGVRKAWTALTCNGQARSYYPAGVRLASSNVSPDAV
jgi:hypothetical protein